MNEKGGYFFGHIEKQTSAETAPVPSSGETKTGSKKEPHDGSENGSGSGGSKGLGDSLALSSWWAVLDKGMEVFILGSDLKIAHQHEF